MTYEAFRQFADSWGLLFMVILWASFVLWVFRPGSKKHHDDAANMIFDESENDGRD
ncbi:MAG: cbb3-type cytochrome c oxidase subunit 3 [Parasphingopyxis sp.]|uniref:cbb3-type cytochrome c oxidase subunit 3 n=1 Tax=Parasphingopyxis sp. TaxID=1920299 RepID=UPI003F9FADB9